MFGWIGQFLSIVRGLLELYRAWERFQAEQRAKEAEKKRKEREDAVDKSKGDLSEDDIWEEQEKIVENKP